MAGEQKKRKTTPRGNRVMTTVTSVRFPIDLLDALNKQADERGIYTTALINEVLQAHVKRALRKRAESVVPAIFG